MTPTQKPTVKNLLFSTCDYIRDTAAHFFPTLLRVNAIYLIATCLIAYLSIDMLNDMNISNFGFDPKYIFGSMKSHHMYYNINDMLPSSLTWIYCTMISILVLIVTVGLVVLLAFTPSYMILQDRNGTAPTYRQIISFLRERMGKLLIMTLFFILLYIPVILICVFAGVLLLLTIIGLVFIPLLMLTIFLLGELIMYAYLEDKDISFFDAMDKAWSILMTGFWRNTFVNGLIYLIISIIASVFNVIMEVGVQPSQVFFSVTVVFMTVLIHFLIGSVYSVNVGVIYFYGKKQLQTKS